MGLEFLYGNWSSLSSQKIHGHGNQAAKIFEFRLLPWCGLLPRKLLTFRVSSLR
jgi:hypothetical protein